MRDLPFHVAELEHDTGTLVMPNGSLLHVPKTAEGQEFSMACARATVDARREWEHPR